MERLWSYNGPLAKVRKIQQRIPKVLLSEPTMSALK
jgi:hypothetical protein